MEKYETDEFGDEIYPVKNGDQIYIKPTNNFEIMAKKKDSNGNFTPYFARNRNNHPICPLLKDNMKYLELNIPYPKNSENNKELYPKRNEKEYYIGLNENCIYAKNEDGVDYFATYKNKSYYAFRKNKKGDVIEFPVQNKNNEFTYIIRDDIFIYPLNLTQHEIIYPVDSDGNQHYLEKEGKQYYGFEDGYPTYAKNKNKDDILALNNQSPYYAFCLVEGNEYYPSLQNKDEFYLIQNGRKVYAKRANKTEYYARTRNRNEILADDKNEPYYALSYKQIEIYPSNNLKNDFYKIVDNMECVAKNKITNVGFYAKNFLISEFYPKTFHEELDLQVEEKITQVEPTLNDIMVHNASK